MTFTKSKIMDMVNKAVARAREHPEEQEAMYYALYYVACFSITPEEFGKLILNHLDGSGVYRAILFNVTDRTYRMYQ